MEKIGKMESLQEIIAEMAGDVGTAKNPPLEAGPNISYALNAIFCKGEFGIMTDKRTQQDAENSNMAKDPAEWVTGDEPMTGAQRSYLKTLSEEAHESFDDNLTKAEASKRIEELQQKTGRGAGTEGSSSKSS